MSDSHPVSPPRRPRLPSEFNPPSHSRSLTPRHEYTPSPPHRSSYQPASALTPPSRKRYRSPSPRTSPPRKLYRQRYNPFRSTSPSRHPHHSRPSYPPYRSPSPRNHHSRSISPPPRYRSPPIRSSPNLPSPNRPSPRRRRYYSPPPRPSPPRHPDSRYPPSESRPPSLRPSRPSRTRSPRSLRDNRRRDKRRRQRDPVSPSKRIPDHHVHHLFLEALKLVLRYRRPPFNISVISDYMSSIDPKWSVRNSHYHTFSDLCRLQESRDHLRLARHGESVVINSSKYEPDTLEPRPRDTARQKSQRDRDRPGTKDRDKFDHIDPIWRRDWDLEERAAARKERFREDKQLPLSITKAPDRSNQTSPDQYEEGATVTKRTNERDVSRGSRDGGSGTTTPNGVEAAETNPPTRSIHNASPPRDSSQTPTEKPFDTHSNLKVETSLHCPSGSKIGSMLSTTEGDDKVEASS